MPIKVGAAAVILPPLRRTRKYLPYPIRPLSLCLSLPLLPAFSLYISLSPIYPRLLSLSLPLSPTSLSLSRTYPLRLRLPSPSLGCPLSLPLVLSRALTLSVQDTLQSSFPRLEELLDEYPVHLDFFLVFCC